MVNASIEAEKQRSIGEGLRRLVRMQDLVPSWALEEEAFEVPVLEEAVSANENSQPRG